MDGPTGLRLIRYWITRADGPGYLNRWPFGPKNGLKQTLTGNKKIRHVELSIHVKNPENREWHALTTTTVPSALIDGGDLAGHPKNGQAL